MAGGAGYQFPLCSTGSKLSLQKIFAVEWYPKPAIAQWEILQDPKMEVR